MNQLDRMPTVNRKKIGDTVVTLLSDGYIDGSFTLLNDIDEGQAETLLAQRGVPAIPRININAYVLQTAEHTILVDSGMGGLHGGGGDLQAALAAAAIDPLQIDTILLTHAHPDHIGGLITPSSVPLFPNVQQLFIHEKELAFWESETAFASVNENMRANFAPARKALGSYSDRLVPFNHEAILPGIQAVPLFGHTPGHCGYLLGNERESLLIWGDIVHFPHIQTAQPEVTVAFDNDPAAAAQARKAILERAVSDNLTVSGMHFNTPASGTVRREGRGYRLDYDF
ncbi:MBL fold metallo-hydrolase [Kalamiella sp. sgz302252]|uniref:MBL fold metallo-hydrolase n=1 Tax=Pantoea sp. sgz302252 TaxID=3341827 RepID=UPI0036D29019